MKKVLIFVISGYKKFVSPLLSATFGKSCRFTPTCSEYTIKALDRFGATKGLILGVKRVLKCHPWGKFGYDPIPDLN